MTNTEVPAIPPDWSFHVAYWVADGDPEPDVPFPKDWGVCGEPDFDPFAMRHQDRRCGTKTLAWPTYHVSDPAIGLDAVCQLLERMTPAAMASWLSLQDGYLSISCGNTEMDAAEVDPRGFLIASELIQRLPTQNTTSSQFPPARWHANRY
jgi:hypothetical protein